MIHDGSERLSDGVVTLREITRADSRDLYRWRTHPFARERFHSPSVFSFEAHHRFLEAYFGEGNDDAWYVIEHEGRPVGAIALYHPPHAPARWEVGRLVIDVAHRGVRGFRYCQRAYRLVIDFGLTRAAELWCEVLGSNRVMRAIVESVGFVPVGEGERNGRRFHEYVVRRS